MNLLIKSSIFRIGVEPSPTSSGRILTKQEHKNNECFDV